MTASPNQPSTDGRTNLVSTPSGSLPTGGEHQDDSVGVPSPRSTDVSGVVAPTAPGTATSRDAAAALPAEDELTKLVAAGLPEELRTRDVHRLRQARVVPEAAKAPIAPRPPALPARPVYDPFSARRRRSPEWLVSYTVGLLITDLVAVGVGMAAAVSLPLSSVVPTRGVIEFAAICWVALIALLGGYAERRLGSGNDEYHRVAVSGLAALALLTFAAALLPDDGLERLVLVAAPVATAMTLLGRLFNRRRMQAARRRGLMTKRVVVVGRDVAAVDLVRRLRRDPAAGLRVVGACVPRPGDSLVLADEGVPVLGGLDDVLSALDEVGGDAVVIASTSETAAQYTRDLAWRLEGTNIDVLVGPGLIEVASNRLQLRPTTSLPLIQIQEPEFRGSRRLVKSLMDRTVAAALLLVAAPGMIAIVLAVRLTSSGPAFFRHRRIGKRGREFDLLKFRSMVTDSDDKIESLMTLNEGNEVQFKMRNDPRVTRVGSFLRKYSLDELPQLINVLTGDMSLVGPRPHVTREVEQYGPDMHRRLLVKPGITGLWQVSGRSDLSWEETVELDVRYVENWSLGLDITILWRTFRAVLGSNGAY
jgi:exopolysaccharide biosynthesis polyprenyl glycosylphosphotransferase